VSYIDLRLMTWPDAAELEGTDAIGLIPTGALEQHGPHLPMIMDSVHAEELGRRVAELLSVPVVVAPTVRVGLSSHHVAFPGTVTLTPEVFGSLVIAHIEAFERMGIRRVALFSAHGGNFTELGRIAARHADASPETTVVAYDDLQRFIDVFIEAGRSVGLDPPVTDVHAGLLETSVALALFEAGDVRPFQDVEGYTAAEPGWLERLMSSGIHEVSANGVLGSPAGATAEAGRVLVDALAVELATWVATELGVPLSDLTRARM
jgi:creatinine amidohydrolase